MNGWVVVGTMVRRSTELPKKGLILQKSYAKTDSTFLGDQDFSIIKGTLNCTGQDKIKLIFPHHFKQIIWISISNIPFEWKYIMFLYSTSFKRQCWQIIMFSSFEFDNYVRKNEADDISVFHCWWLDNISARDENQSWWWYIWQR